MIETLYNVWDTLHDGMIDIFQWFLTDYELLGFSGQVYELFIGAGLVAVLGYIIYNWIV